MHYLVIDTCVWLDIGKEIVDTTIIDKITDFVKRRKICILIPCLIKEEWDKHKVEKIITHNEQSILGKLKNIKDLSNFITDEKKDTIKDIISIKDEIVENAKKRSAEMIEKIEFIFNYPTTKIILINDQVKLQAIEWGLEKKAPFHRKSSMSDALIILGAANYIKAHNLYQSLFITSNIKDFSSEKNKKQIHDDLLEITTKNVNIDYYTNIGEALNEIENNVISIDVIAKIENKVNQMLCYKCASPMDSGSWKPSQYGGLTWQYTCPACRSRYDTGEFFD